MMCTPSVNAIWDRAQGTGSTARTVDARSNTGSPWLRRSNVRAESCAPRAADRGSGLRAGLHRRRVRLREVRRRHDETQVRERLGEVADQPLGVRVVLLGQHPHVVLQASELLEQFEGLV